MSRRTRAAWLAAVSSFGLYAGVARGDAITWGNAAGGTFNVGGNWLGGVVPGANDTAAFSLNSTYNVLFNNSPTNANVTLGNGSVSFASASVVRTWTITGNFTQSGGVASLSSGGQPITLNIGGNMSLSNGQMFVLSGADLDFDSGTIANGTDQTITITDAGSSLNQTLAAGNFFVGRSGAGGTVIFQTSAVGTFAGSLGIADSSTANSTGFFKVLTGSDVHASNVKIGGNGLAGQIGTLLVSGAGSTFAQTGGASLTIGTTSTSAGTLSVGPGAVFTSGSGAININATGHIVNTGGTVNLNGTTTFVGSTASYDGGAVGAILNIASNVPVTFDDAQATIQSLNLTNPGSSMTFTNTLGSLAVNGTTTVGAAGGAATFTCSNIPSASLGTVTIGPGSGAGAGVFNVLGSAQIHTGNINIGTNNSSGNGTLNINGGSVGVIGGGVINVGASSSTGTLALAANATLDTGTGGFNITGANSRVNLNGGTLNLNCDLTLTGGTFNKTTANTLNLATGLTLTAQNNGHLILDGGLTTPTGTHIVANGSLSTLEVNTGSLVLVNGSSLSISNGGDATLSTLRIGQSGGNGTATFDGPGTTVQTTSNIALLIGLNSATGRADFTNGAVGTFAGGIGVAQSNANPTGTLTIATGAQVTTGGNLNIATASIVGEKGALTVASGSSFTQTGAGSINIGASANSAATLLINGGNFTSGTGSTQVNATGFLQVSGGTLNAGGDLVINGAGAKMLVGNLSPATVNVAGTLNIASGGTVDFQGGAITARSVLNGDSISYGNSSGTVTVNVGTFAISGTNFTLDSSSSVSTATLQLTNFAQFLGIDNLTIGGTGPAKLLVQSGSQVTCGHLITASARDASVTIERNNASLSADFIELAATADQPGKFLLVRNFATATLNAGTGLLIIHDGAHVTAGADGTLNIGDGCAIHRATTSGASPALVQMSGGTLSVQNLPVVTDFLDAGGTLNFNLGTLVVRSSANFTADVIDRLFPVTHTVGVGQALNLENGTATFSGAVRLDGGTITVRSLGFGNRLELVSGQFNMTFDAVRVGPASQFASLVVNPGLTINASVSVASSALLQVNGGSIGGDLVNNSGEIELLGGTSQISASSSLINDGLISGDGRIFGALSNGSLGTVRALLARKLTFPQNFSGLPHSNAGTFDLLGGTIDMADPLENTGKIIGQGILITGGLTNQVNGSITFSGGVSQLEGSLINQNGARVLVTGGSQATFRNNVTNNAGSVFNVGSNSLATFLGTVTGLSQFTGPGTKIFVGPASGGAIDSNGVGDTVVDFAGNVIASYLHEDSLEVNGRLTVPLNGTNTGVSRMNSLSIDSPGKFDLTDNDLILDYSGATPIGTIRTFLQQGFAGGAWTGNGLTSSAAATASASTHPTGLGYAEASSLGLSTFDGQSIDNSTVLIRYTWRGDANLDGLVNALDFNALATNFGGSGKFWVQADFNYDGIINTLDFNSLAVNFNQPPLASPALGDLVPEPCLLAIAVIPLTMRLRRRGY